MASCLQLPMASSHSIRRVSSMKSRFVTNSTRFDCSTFHTPLKKPKDPSLNKIVTAAGPTAAEIFLGLTPSSNKSPILNCNDSPTLMPAFPNQATRPPSSNGRRRRKSRPPDMASMLFRGRIVYIGLPLVPFVTELVIAQLMLLNEKPEKPIYIYINSTGTSSLDDERIASEREGFAIYDAMMMMKCEINTLALGTAFGHACLILAAGTKGKRFMMPHSLARIEEPSLLPSGAIQANDIAPHVKELYSDRDTMVKYLAMHTGNSEEVILDTITRGPLYMHPTKAIEFGVADRIIGGEDKILIDVRNEEVDTRPF